MKLSSLIYENKRTTTMTITNTKCILFSAALLLIATGCSGSLSGKGYEVKDGKVVWKDWNAGQGKFEVTIDKADAASFESRKHSTYGVDRQNCFYKELLIAGADPESFESLNEYYAKDKKQAYLRNEVIPGADGSTFQLVKGMYAKDSGNCFHHKSTLPGADPESFRVLGLGAGASNFATDGKSCYSGSLKIPTDDAANFKILSHGYATDSSNVFYRERILNGADVATFQMIGDTIRAKDKNATYVGGVPERIDGLIGSRWLRSHEEESANDSVEIYRLSSFKFPPSRFRMEYKFKQDGTCEWLEASPTDGDEMRVGEWSFDQTNNRLTIVQGDKTLDYSVEEKTRKTLHLKPQ